MGEEPLIKKFMKGVFNERPALPRYQSSWSVDKVLNYLSGMPSVSEMSLKDLTFELVMLLALITGQICQTLHLLDLKDLHVTGDGVKFVINSLVKQSRLGCTQPILNLISYPHNIKLCIVSVLREYLVRTRSCRSSSKLFISFVKPHKPVSKDTVARWIKCTMQKSGIDISVFKPHSTRSASTSKAAAKQIPLRTIMNTAGWSRQSTFTKFYKKTSISL